jgi:hypothetical protein
MALNQLKRDGWKEADDAYKQHLSSLVGDHEVKNWSILKIPEDSAKCFLDGELFATGVNINGQNQEIMSSTNRPQAEQVFPLVVVEYERVYEDRVVVSLYPRKLELFHAEPLELGGPL